MFEISTERAGLFCPQKRYRVAEQSEVVGERVKLTSEVWAVCGWKK